MLDFRDDSLSPGAANNALIARCSADPTTPNADRCDFLNIEDDLTWIFSTTVKPALDTGPTARVPCQD